jgi:hypothetical protein
MYNLLDSFFSIFFHLNTTQALGVTIDSACQTLAKSLPGKVSYPNTTVYESSIASYFSAEESDLTPLCVLSPSDAQDVSIIISRLSKSRSQFAIRSGGHTPFAGAANIDNGITIDLSGINQVQVSQDQSTVEIGTGARWIDVYNVLDSLQITVPGGRVADIGVGGFLTGGGINFIGPYAGWGCDSVIEYEVVLASGEIVIVNDQSYSDLFVALKGGSNNLAVVTKVVMKTWPLGSFWGGFISYPISSATKQLAAYSRFMDPENIDPHAAMIQAFGYDNINGSNYFVVLGLQYTKPQAYPPVFQPFIDNSTMLYNTMRISTMSDFVTEEGAHQIYHTR